MKESGVAVRGGSCPPRGAGEDLKEEEKRMRHIICVVVIFVELILFELAHPWKGQPASWSISIAFIAGVLSQFIWDWPFGQFHEEIQ